MSAPTEAEIRSLLTNYSPSSIPPLEAYLEQQLLTLGSSNQDATAATPYIPDAVRTLVKFYQLFPGTSDRQDEWTAAAFFMTMTTFPSTDLLAVRYLLPNSSLTSEPCATIQTAASQLQACQFGEFWKTYEQLLSSSNPVVAAAAPKAVPVFQRAIASVLALTYQRASVAVVTKSLNLTASSSLESLPSVERVEGDSVVFVATADNTKRRGVYQEGVNFATVSALLSKIAQ